MHEIKEVNHRLDGQTKENRSVRAPKGLMRVLQLGDKPFGVDLVLPPGGHAYPQLPGASELPIEAEIPQEHREWPLAGEPS